MTAIDADPRHAARWRRIASDRSMLIIIQSCGLLVGGVICLLLVRSLAWSGDGPSQVVWIYRQAGLDIRAGISPYTCAINYATTHAPSDWRSILMGCYVYPPLLGLAFAPFASLPLSTVAFLWEVLSLACALYVARAVARIVLPGERPTSRTNRLLIALLIVDVLLFFGPMRRSMREGQADIVVIALLVAAWQALRADRQVRSGLLLGLAVAIKPTNIVMLGFYVWRRQWRSAAVAFATGTVAIVVLFLLLPHRDLTDYLQVSAYWNSPGFLMAPKSVSLLGVVQRALYSSSGMWRIVSQPLVARVLEVGVGLALYLAASTRVSATAKPADASADHAWGAMILVLLLGSPLTEPEHMAVAVVVLALLLRPLIARLSDGDKRVWADLGLVAILFLYLSMPETVLDVLGHARQSDYQGLVGFLVASYMFFGLAGLAALYVRAGRKAPYETTAISTATLAKRAALRVLQRFSARSSV